MDFARLLYVDGMAAAVVCMPTILVIYWLLDRTAPAKRQGKAEVPRGASFHAAE